MLGTVGLQESELLDLKNQPLLRMTQRGIEMHSDDLLKEISNAFPPVEMPARDQLPAHQTDCFECKYHAEYLEENARDKEVTGEIIRYLCIDMGCLSPQAWFWILPHYLRFCVTAGDQIDGLETEYLIYNFGPSPEHEAEKRKSLSLLSSEQVLCLVHFVEWVHAEEKWEKYSSEDLEKALRFLKTLEVQT